MTRLVRLLISVVAFAFLVAACGVPTDDAPRAIASDEIPDELVAAPTTTSTPDGGVVDADLFFIETVDGRSVLRREQAMVENRLPSTVLEALVATIPEDLPDGITTSIPADTSILRTELDAGVLTVDLSEEFETVSADLLIQAVGQLVYSAMASAGVTVGVLFQVEGEDREFPDADGSEITGPATLADYGGLLPDA